MRETKFRLRINNKIVGFEKWHCGYLPSASPRWLYSNDGEYWNPTYIYHRQKDSFVGLLDGKHKEIYEGDIVKHNLWGTFQIIWDDICASPRAVSKDGENDLNLGSMQLKRCKIIGNIFENPKLFK